MWKKFNHFFALVLFSLISSALIFSWFKDGKLYGGGDVGLQTYNPQRILENARYVWWDSAGPGASLPQGLSAIPFQSGLYVLQILGFSPVAMQATLFFLLLILMGFGMYLFVSTLFPGNKKYPFIAGIFYMFNPYMMIQVWHRFIHTTIILAAALPFFAIFWNKWIREGKLKYLLFFLLTTFLAVYAFGTYAFILAVWIFLSLFAIAAIIPWQGSKYFYRVSFRFIFGLVVWILINAWWMIPVSQISPAVLSEQHKTEESLMTLITISAQEILPYSMQLVNPFYLVNQAEFGAVYKNILFQIIPWAFVFLILLGLVNSIKHRKFALFGIFYLFALFLAKGAAPPFGNIYIFGFTNIFALGVLRNPFEKTGLILVFFSTVLFTLGLKILSERFGKLPVFLICALIFVFSWPMLLGKVIGKPDQPAFVEVPKSYQDADMWLRKQKETGVVDGKILHLPLTTRESIRYKWRLGYNGLEPSDTFFTSYPSISRGFNIHRIDDTLTGLSSAFENDSIDSARILGNLQDFNIRFIVLHKDVDFLAEGLGNPEDIEKLLDKLEFLNRKQQFGDLIIYQVTDQAFGPRISLEHDISLVYPGEEKLSFWPALIKKPATKYISPVETWENLAQVFVFPKATFLYGVSSDSARESADFYLERLKGLKPVLAQTGQMQSLDLVDKIINLSSALNSNIGNYGNILRQIFPKGIEVNRFEAQGQESLLSAIFRMHLTALANLQQPKLKEELEKNLIKFNLKPRFFDTDIQERQVFRFNIPVKAGYDLMMLDASITSLYPGNLNQIKFFINNNQSLLNSSISGSALLFGNLALESGSLEVSYPALLSNNLALSATYNKEVSLIEVPISGINGQGTYRISSNVRVDQGSGFYVLLYENQNPNPSIKEFLQVTPSAQWQRFQMNFQTKPGTKTAKIIILMSDRDGNLYSVASFDDIRIQRVLDNQILLRSSAGEQAGPASADEQVEFTKLSPVSFEGKIKILNPGFLFFKETFHPDWQLTLINTDGTKSLKKHFLGNLYANAWYIDEAGEYEFKINFKGQENFSKGILLTGIGFLAVAGYWILMKRFK